MTVNVPTVIFLQCSGLRGIAPLLWASLQLHLRADAASREDSLTW